MHKHEWLLAFVISSAIGCPTACLAQGDVTGFYKDKTITIRVGYGPGGS
jgi:hypothetical protein